MEVGIQPDVVDNDRARLALKNKLLERDPAIVLSENITVRVDAMMIVLTVVLVVRVCLCCGLGYKGSVFLFDVLFVAS